MAVKYCAYCGAKMTMSARFCSQCGKAVENIPEDELDGKAGSQEIKTTEMTAKPVKGKKTTALKHHIDFCGRKLEFDAAIVPYNSLRRSFMDYSDNMKEEFISYYKSNVHNFNDMYDRGLQTFLEKGKAAFDFSVSVLETYGIHTSAEAVFQRTPDHSAIAAVVEHYSDIADQFIDFAQQLSAYRASNRARQFRMQGGGFGITGGIKGAEENIAKVKSLIDKYDYDTLWEMAEQGNAYAQFRLKKLYDPDEPLGVNYYHGRVDSRADAPYASEVLETYSGKGYLFAQFLQAFYPYRKNTWGSSASHYEPSPEVIRDAKIIYSLAQKGAIPAMSVCGCMVKKCKDAIGLSDEESLKFLLAAADAFDEDAILELNKRTYVDKTHTVPSWPISEEQYNYYRTLWKYAVGPRYGNSSAKTSQKTSTHSSSSSSSSGCYITSAVCRTFGKPDDCYELTAFRKFRDEWLAEQPGGKELIQEYYQTAPLIVKRIDEREDSREIYQTIWTDYLKKCLSDIETGAFSQCKEKYMAMVNSLKGCFAVTMLEAKVPQMIAGIIIKNADRYGVVPDLFDYRWDEDKKAFSATIKSHEEMLHIVSEPMNKDIKLEIEDKGIEAFRAEQQKKMKSLSSYVCEEYAKLIKYRE